MILRFPAITLVGVMLERPRNISTSHDHLDHIDCTDNPTYLKINLFTTQLFKFMFYNSGKKLFQNHPQRYEKLDSY